MVLLGLWIWQWLVLLVYCSFVLLRGAYELLTYIYIVVCVVMYTHAKHLRCKKVRPSKVESYLEVNTQADWRQQDLISECGQGLAYWTQALYTKCIIASYCFQSLIIPANLLSAISCYKFHISKDQQENMKFTIICHLAAFLFMNSHWQKKPPNDK